MAQQNRNNLSPGPCCWESKQTKKRSIRNWGLKLWRAGGSPSSSHSWECSEWTFSRRRGRRRKQHKTRDPPRQTQTARQLWRRSSRPWGTRSAGKDATSSSDRPEKPKEPPWPFLQKNEWLHSIVRTMKNRVIEILSHISTNIITNHKVSMLATPSTRS